MIYRLFVNTNQWVAYFLSAITLLLIAMGSHFFGISNIESDQSLWLPICYFAMIFSGTLMLNEYLIRLKLTGVNNYLPQFIAILFMINVPWSFNHLQLLVAIILSCIAIYRLIDLYNKPKEYVRCFEVGLLFGIATIIAHSFWPSFILGVLAIGWIKPTTIRDYLSYSIGFLFVLAIYFVFGYLTDLPLLEGFFTLLEFHIPQLGALSFFGKIAIIIIFVLSVYLIFKGLANWDKQNVKTRLHYRIWLFFLLLIGPAVTFYYPNNPLENSFLILGLPLAVLSMETIRTIKKKVWISIICYLLLVSAVFIRIVN